jgi:biopolymer transport protein ExbB
MYYGNDSVASQNSTSTWDSNYRDVIHLGESGACPLTFSDATSNGFTFSCSNTPTNNASSKIGNGRTFASASSQSLTGSASVDDTMTAKQLTVSGWFNSTTVAAGTGVILRNDGGTTNTTLLEGFALQRNTNKLAVSMFDTATRTPTRNTTLSASTWYYGTMTYDGTNVIVYVNGNPDGSIAASGTYNLSAVALTAGGSGGSLFFNGSLDQFEVSDNVRTPTWIATEYANQNSPATFYSVGSEEGKIYAATNDLLMRHGKFFDNTGANYGKQPFLF